MDSISLSGLRQNVRPAAKGAAEGALAALIGGVAAAAVWRGPGQCRGIVMGLGSAWLASSLSTAALIFAKTVSARAFWWSFGAGMALRFAVLAGLMAYSVHHPATSQAGLLLSYVFGVLLFLILEARHIRLK